MVSRLKRSAAQKKKILDKARELFWVKGYDKTSIRNIAGACGFEPSNVYNYFSNKEQLLYEILREGLERQVSLIADLENDSAHSPVERLRMLIQRNIHHVLGYRRSSGLLFDVGLKNLSPARRKKIIEYRDAYDRIMRKVIRDGVESGDFAEVDDKLAGFAITSIITRSRVWFSSRGRLSADQIADFMFEFVLNGLRSGKTAPDLKTKPR